MRTIYKYTIPFIPSGVVIWMPKGAEVMHVAFQRDEDDIKLWAAVDTDAKLEERRVRIVGTGQELPEGAWRHVGTVVTSGGDYVWHVLVDRTRGELVKEVTFEYELPR